MANTSLLSAFERMWQHVVAALGNKSDADHTHEASDITSGILPVANGGTGRTDAIPIVYSETIPTIPEAGVIYAIPI